MVEITASLVLQVVQTIALVVGIVYYITIMRNAQKSKHRELIHQKLQSLSLDYSKAFWEIASWTDWDTVEEFNEKHGMPDHPEAKAKFSFVMRRFDIGGTLLKENIANSDLIFQLYPVQAVISLWDQFEPVIRDTREAQNSPTHMEGFEFLYKAAKEMHPGVISRNLR